MKERKLYEKAIGTWGVEAQIKQFHEEVGELLSALGKYARRRVPVWNVADEIADVKIMLEQLEVIFDCSDRVDDRKDIKIKRLKRKLGVYYHEKEENNKNKD